MYFASRVEAGYRLAIELLPYRYENCVVVALSDGGVIVGQQIAASLHCTLAMLLVDTIDLPGENQTFGTMNQSGRFTYNGLFSAGEIEEYYSEYHGYLDDQKRQSFSRISHLLGNGGIVDEDMLREQVVILVSDGFENGASLDAAADFIKPVHVKRLVIAAPVASVEAVDRMHILADELHVLGATDNFMGTDHYYDANDVPDHEKTLQALNDNILNWR
jgi:predicted phosphoribosyltransferase